MTRSEALSITLVANGELPLDVVADVVAAVGASHTERLGASAADVFASGARKSTREAVEAVLTSAAERGAGGIDAIVQPAAGRQKRLLISDMDSTLIAQECIDELAAAHGLKPQVAAITERAMAGELDFAAALTERVALLAGIPVAAIEGLLRETITLSPGAAVLMATCRARGIRTVLVSGGFTAFARPIARRLGMDAAFANRLLDDGSTLTGSVAPPILGADAKRETLRRECDGLGIAPHDAIALGDGANDLAMLSEAGLGLGYRPKPRVAAQADGTIQHTPLTTALYALGVKADEFVNPTV